MKNYLVKYAESLVQSAFTLGAVHEAARSLLDKDLPPELQTRFRPEIKRYKDGRLLILWCSRDITNLAGRTHYDRMWPDNSGDYSQYTLDAIAQPTERKLVRKLEKCFAMVRHANSMLKELDKSVQSLDQISDELSFVVRDLYNQFQEHLYDLDVEEALAGFNVSPDVLADSSERVPMNDA